MTIYTIYADTSDHCVESSSAVYATARSGAGLTDAAAGTSGSVGQSLSGGTYFVDQYFPAFDASGVPAGTSDNSLSLTINGGGSAAVVWAERNWAGGTGDFVAGASLSGLTKRGTASISGSGAKTINATSATLARSVVEFILYPQNQEDNVAPAGLELFSFSSADATGTTNDPRLTLDVTVPAIGRSFGLIIA